MHFIYRPDIKSLEDIDHKYLRNQHKYTHTYIIFLLWIWCLSSWLVKEPPAGKHRNPKNIQDNEMQIWFIPVELVLKRPGGRPPV